MANTTFTVLEVPGSKRASARPYSHAIIGRRDGRCSAVAMAADLAENESKYVRWDAKNWDDWKRAAEATVGQLYRNHNGFMVEAKDYTVRTGSEFIASNPDREAYMAGEAAKRQSTLDNLRVAEPGELAVLQWSMSMQNALKAAGTYRTHHSDVRVVECVPVVKAKKAAELVSAAEWRKQSHGKTDR